MRFFIPAGRQLWFDGTEAEWFQKAARSHKYTRRVLIGVDSKTGRKRYRYYYSEASLAHEVKAGTRINLGKALIDVVSVKGSTVSYTTPDGTAGTMELAELHNQLHAHYRDRMVRGAQRVAKRWASAHLKRGQIIDTSGDPPSGAKARRLWDRYKAALAKAKTGESHTRSLVAFLLRREGWQSESRQALLDLAATGAKDTALVVSNMRQIIRAAENLRSVDAAAQVEPAHVMEASERRLPGTGKADKFPEKWTELKNRLAQENAHTSAALDAVEAVAKGGGPVPKALLEFVKGAVRLDASLEAERMAQTFPALRTDDDLKVAHELAARYRAVVAAAVPNAGSADGVEATVYIADKDGFPQPRRIRYRLREAVDVHASHLPGSGFKANPAYPENVQERAYHRDKGEQNKVRSNADRFRPDLVHNTNPDAVNGAPVVTNDGVVLGGNSRTMTMQLLYASGRGDQVKGHLEKNAYQFGFTPEQVNGMTNPVLVRELVDTSAAETDKAELKDLVRRANESFTQGMDPRTEQVALAQRIDDNVIGHLSETIGPDQTLNAYLSANTNAARAFVGKLQSAGIIDRRNASQFVRDDGRLNQDGRSMVERLMVGKLVPDPDLLSELPLPMVSALARSAPSVLSAATANKKHDLREDLAIALRTQVDMKYAGQSTLKEHLAQMRLGGDGPGEILGEPPIAKNERARVLFELLDGHSGTKVAKIMRTYAASAGHDVTGQVGLFGEAPDPLDTLRRAIRRGAPVDKAVRFVISQPQRPAWHRALQAIGGSP